MATLEDWRFDHEYSLKTLEGIPYKKGLLRVKDHHTLL